MNSNLKDNINKMKRFGWKVVLDDYSALVLEMKTRTSKTYQITFWKDQEEFHLNNCTINPKELWFCYRIALDLGWYFKDFEYIEKGVGK